MLIFYVTFPNTELAKQISQTLLEQKLIACFNLFPMQSGYIWEGTVCLDDEVVGLLKTHESLESALTAAIEQLHPYEVPCIMRWHATANSAYENWIRASVHLPTSSH